MSLTVVLVAAVMFGVVTGFVVLPIPPTEAWPRATARLVPLVLLVGVVLAWATSR